MRREAEVETRMEKKRKRQVGERESARDKMYTAAQKYADILVLLVSSVKKGATFLITICLNKFSFSFAPYTGITYVILFNNLSKK